MEVKKKRVGRKIERSPFFLEGSQNYIDFLMSACCVTFVRLDDMYVYVYFARVTFCVFDPM